GHGTEARGQERHRADQSGLEGAGEGAPMPACFAALRDDGIHSRRLERDRFLHGRRGANDEHAPSLEPLEGLRRETAEREAEDRCAGLERGGELFVEGISLGGRDFWTRQRELCVEWLQALESQPRLDWCFWGREARTG